MKRISSNIARLAKSFLFFDARPRSPTLQAPTVRRHLPTFPFPAVPPFTSLRRTGGELMTKHTQQLRVTRRPLGLSVPLSSALSSPPIFLSHSSFPCRLKAPSLSYKQIQVPTRRMRNICKTHESSPTRSNLFILR